jgi:hypothetical protein
MGETSKKLPTSKGSRHPHPGLNNPPPDFLIYDLSHTIKKVTRIVIGHIHYYVFLRNPGFRFSLSKCTEVSGSGRNKLGGEQVRFLIGFTEDE